MTPIRNRWIWAIRRDEGVAFTVRKESTFVCAKHFKDNEVRVQPESARQTRTAKEGVCGRKEEDDVEMEDVDAAVLMKEHDYDSRPPPGALDEALEKIKELEELVSNLTISWVLLNRCVSDEDFKYLTRFSSKNIFFVFWRSIEPSASKIVFKLSPQRKMQLIDEFFMFCLRVTVGLRERVLAEIFGVSTSTVSRTLITWSNYLYLVLGSVNIWMTQEQQYCPNVRVIIVCTEFRCESPDALTIHSETFSTVAPCGAITFASKLFTGSISDKELTRQSGILTLLEPGDEVMALSASKVKKVKGFLVEKLLEDTKSKLIIHPFKHHDQFSREETEITQAIARLRILVEPAIRQIKEYHIWDSPIPLALAGTVNQIWSCCCMMVNYQGPLDLQGEVKYWVE
ncbi:hypothetical protein IRJ41_017133 [Triplophysa rosa]|uniref:THAP-type domain-containing protein n=1 Tax=Triplophysa rosa TaxID=992332 RepID=A0A9W7TSY1_TRIRA|nr:hypothetical protein IRJ41_017133 [Triplophysa rosa]